VCSTSFYASPNKSWFHLLLFQRLFSKNCSNQATGKNGDADVLHPQLVRQYDVSENFHSERNRFAKLLLSPRGIEKHRSCCTTDGILDCNCKPFLRIFKSKASKAKKKCYDCLKRNAFPKLAIANGNCFGQLMEQLRNMTLGNRSLVCLVHYSAHLVAYT
jgi:hypothetical protein